MPRQELIDWLNDQLEKTNLSQSEASRRAGLGPNAISEIINGRTPGLKVCVALAELFGFSPEYVLRLAGHLPPRYPQHRRDPRLQATAEKLFEIWDFLAAVDPDALDRLLTIVVAQAEMVEAAANVARRAAEESEKVEPKITKT